MGGENPNRGDAVNNPDVVTTVDLLVAERDALKTQLAKARDEAFDQAAVVCLAYGKRMEDEFCVNNADGDGFAEAVRSLKSDPASKEMTFEDLKAAVVFQRQRAEDAERERDRLNAQWGRIGATEWIGPCEHGRDPWTRCETCEAAGEGPALLAALHKAETERDSLRAQLAKAQEDAKAADWRERGAPMQGEPTTPGASPFDGHPFLPTQTGNCGTCGYPPDAVRRGWQPLHSESKP